MPKYSELYTETFTGVGLLSQITSLAGCPWNNSVDQTQVEMAYANRSASKNINPNFVRFTDEYRPLILLAYFREKWQKLWDTYLLDYNPLSPYKVDEVGEHNKQNTGSDATEYGKEIAENATDEGTIQNTGTNTDNGARNVYGYNSDVAVPSETTNDNGTSESTETRDLTGNRNITQSGTDTTTKSDTEVYDYSVNKTGNLGFITPQDMIRREFEIWNSPFFERVFSDVDSFIALKIY